MDESLKQWHKLGTFNEAYEIVQSVIVSDKNNKYYRIDILKYCKVEKPYYNALFYIKAACNLQLSQPDVGKRKNNPTALALWVFLKDMPLVVEGTKKKALYQALALLAERSI